ncbi:polyprenol reductase-like [Chelonus insularis]|uniref:polyprenol reductase-like n=1 Tax=Chelonus insularis TaxID=460826 RepID=UPI00158A3E30|nr:polyprenol reductase-like [Chelonus insularis]
MILMTIHVWKRFYESHYVTIYSQARISFLLYIIGLVHYSMLVSTIVGESYGFVRGFHKSFQFNKFATTYNIICSVVMLMATYEQFRTNIILVNLRKNKTEEILCNSYKLPTGRLFDFISTPLQFTEIVIYLTLTAILWENSTIHYISMWVFMNQMANGFFQHQWYKQNFENYPNRKIIIPFIW